LSGTSTPSLIVTASSRIDPGKYGTANVFVSLGDSGQPAVTGVSVSPVTASVAQGGHQPFTATVLGANNPSQSVRWTVSRADGIAVATGTYIDDPTSSTPTLYVAADEAVTNATGVPRLVVQANSIADGTKYGIANVTVTASGGTGGGGTTGTGLTINPSSIGVVQGGSQQFTAYDTATNVVVSDVTWNVYRANGEPGLATGTSIGPAGSVGLLYVGADEVLAGPSTPSLIVTASSRIDPGKYGTANVFVSLGGSSQPAVTGVSVSPSTASVAQGGHQPFTATVLGANNPSQSVSWTVSRADGIAVAEGTYIDNTTGTLYVAADEAVTNATGEQRLVVTAASTADGTKYGVANVTVTASGGSTGGGGTTGT
jgi:hypothetical protein